MYVHNYVRTYTQQAVKGARGNSEYPQMKEKWRLGSCEYMYKYLSDKAEKIVITFILRIY